MPRRDLGKPRSTQGLLSAAGTGERQGTNPEFGEPGWLSARPLSQPDWAQWYDLYRAGGGGNPLPRDEFNELAEGSPQDSNQLRGAVTRPYTTLNTDPYYRYKTLGLGPGYDPRYSLRDVILAAKGREGQSLRGLKQAIGFRPDMRIR